MRLGNAEIQAINGVITKMLIEKKIDATLYLHGSRADDALCGGDIDLLLLVCRADLIDVLRTAKPSLLVAIKDHIGDQKIDLTIDWAGHSLSSGFLQVVLPKAEVLLRLGQGAFQRTMIHERVEAARAGCNPFAITRLKSGWWVLGDTQFLRGYSLLLPDPVVPDLNSLDESAYSFYFSDIRAISRALLKVTGADRINLEILGNSEPALHAHLFPRYADEPIEDRSSPAWNHS
ncbi:MAG: hypothetical protein AAB425_14355, partial [Bdellovibrionota bacterium]